MPDDSRDGRIKAIQRIIGTKDDGIWGPKSKAALDFLVTGEAWHSGNASSFADPADVRRFQRCKELGGSDENCFKLGDNGIGLWGDDTSEGSGPSCAIPPEDMEERWGSVNAARRKSVIVRANDKEVACLVKDRMPHRANITNSAIIDLNPDAVRALGMEPPIMKAALWRWA